MLVSKYYAGWGAIIVVGFATLLIAGVHLSHPLAASAQTTDALSVFTAVGFTNPKEQPAVGSRFNIPDMMYYRVKESVASAHPEWEKDGVANVIAVSVLPTPWLKGAVPNSANVINDYSGRVSICTFVPDYYVCMIGPDQKKLEAFLTIAKTK
jgi:hypothetical protein